MTERGALLTAGQRLDLLRQLADALRYAQGRRIIPRGLAPQSVLMTRADTDSPVVKVFNWQVGVRDSETASSGTTHVEELVEDKSLIYLAPQAGLTPRQVTPAVDVFSLGTIAYHLFAGRPPATSLLERANQLREHKGFNLAAVLDGAGPKLCELVRYATHPDVSSRIQTAEDFLVWLDEVEAELTAPEGQQAVDPDIAQKGDELEAGFVVERLLGQGSTGKALLVTRDGEEFVLKVARGEEDNARLREEGEVLRKLRSEFIVGLHEVRSMHGRTVLVLDKAGEETLAAYLRQEGKCGLEWLERFGTDLLEALESLERHGIAHREIKPDNIALRGGKQRKQLVLFDFSLARAPMEALRLGTPPYFDPFLPLRKPPRWDAAAERYAVAVTLYEMAAGWQVHPRWGDGQSDPALTDGELNIDADRFDPAVRDGLRGFFLKTQPRDPTKRFDNAEAMKRAWESVFRSAEREAEEVSRPLDLGIAETLPNGLYPLPDGTPVTASSTVAVSGTTNAGATVALEAGSDSNFDEGQTTAGSTGAYSLTAALTPGLNKLQVRANDSFGQQAFASARIDLDTQAPAVTLTSPTSPLTTNTNVTLTSQVTDNLSGVASLQASVDNGAYQPVSFDAQGNYSFTTALALNGGADGLHTVQLRATDHVGNVSTPLTYSFTLDTIPPAVDFHLDAASDTPPVGDGHTTDAVVTLDGTTEPNTPVVLLQAGARTTSDATGAFSFSGVALALGANTFTVQATDQAGNIGAAQHTITRDPAFDNTLVEGTRFLTTLDQTFVVPAQPSMLEFKFGNLSFDDSSPNFMNDAFEASLTDANGNSLVLPIAGSRDAFLNITEGQSSVLSPNVQLTGGTVDVDLSHIAASTQAHLQVRRGGTATEDQGWDADT